MTTIVAQGPEDPLLRINHTGASGNPALWFEQDGATKAYVWWHKANSLLNLGTPVTNPIVSLQNNGNVGIGISNPYDKLQVAAGGVATDSFFAFSHVQSAAPPWGVYLSAPRDDTLGLFTRGQERVTITGDGNVGIGTAASSAFAKLRIYSNDAYYGLEVRKVAGNHAAGSFYHESTAVNAAVLEAFSAGNNSAILGVALASAGIGGAGGSFAANSLSAKGVVIYHQVPGGTALYVGRGDSSFQGNVHITGSLRVDGPIEKQGGGFKIDHPLDPANKCLAHSFVESPDMKNIYDGVMALDERGEAVVELPDWFEALNRDFRYQLTAVGGPAPNLHVAEEVLGNRFRIAGGNAGMKVSWMVTGIRRDAWPNANRIPVESAKSDKDGRTYEQCEVVDAPVPFDFAGPSATLYGIAGTNAEKCSTDPTR